MKYANCSLIFTMLMGFNFNGCVMAEYCIECYNRIHNTELKKRDVTLSVDLCEGCGKVKKTIDTIKKSPRR